MTHLFPACKDCFLFQRTHHRPSLNPSVLKAMPRGQSPSQAYHHFSLILSLVLRSITHLLVSLLKESWYLQRKMDLSCWAERLLGFLPSNSMPLNCQQCQLLPELAALALKVEGEDPSYKHWTACELTHWKREQNLHRYSVLFRKEQLKLQQSGQQVRGANFAQKLYMHIV